LYMLLLMACTHSYILPSSEDFENNNKLEWLEAETYCLSTYNSHLASIHDAHTFSLLRTEIIAMGKDSENFWIGLINTNTERISHSSVYLPTYAWVDSSPFDFGTDLSGTYPWFDERPETPQYHHYVRLWGGSASLLWDDTDGDNKYFWICNDPSNATSHHTHSTISATATQKTTSLITTYEPDEQDEQQQQPQQQESTTSSLAAEMDSFWKFAIVAVLTISTCILLLKLRGVWRSCNGLRKADKFRKQVTDLSILDSINYSRSQRSNALYLSPQNNNYSNGDLKSSTRTRSPQPHQYNARAMFCANKSATSSSGDSRMHSIPGLTFTENAFQRVDTVDAEEHDEMDMAAEAQLKHVHSAVSLEMEHDVNTKSMNPSKLPQRAPEDEEDVDMNMQPDSDEIDELMQLEGSPQAESPSLDTTQYTAQTVCISTIVEPDPDHEFYQHEALQPQQTIDSVADSEQLSSAYGYEHHHDDNRELVDRDHVREPGGSKNTLYQQYQSVVNHRRVDMSANRQETVEDEENDDEVNEPDISTMHSVSIPSLIQHGHHHHHQHQRHHHRHHRHQADGGGVSRGDRTLRKFKALQQQCSYDREVIAAPAPGSMSRDTAHAHQYAHHGTLSKMSMAATYDATSYKLAADECKVGMHENHGGSQTFYFYPRHRQSANSRTRRSHGDADNKSSEDEDGDEDDEELDAEEDGMFVHCRASHTQTANIADDEFVVDGETSDDETVTTPTKSAAAVAVAVNVEHDGRRAAMVQEEADGVKGAQSADDADKKDIKSNISHIMANIQRIRNISDAMEKQSKSEEK